MPWEENMGEMYERKRAKYAELEAECRERGWEVHCSAFGLVYRGYLDDSFGGYAFLPRLGVCGKGKKEDV